MPTASSKIPTISCLPVSLNRMTTPNYIGSRFASPHPSSQPVLFSSHPQDGKTRCTTGSVVSSLYHLKDTENRNEDAGFFVFPDLSVRTEGSYRLKLSLFEVVGYVPLFSTRPSLIHSHSNTVRHCKSIYSAAFYVYTAKKFPGMEGWFSLHHDFVLSELSCFVLVLSFHLCRIITLFRLRRKPSPTQPLTNNQPRFVK